jgi:hypothetical protein
MGAAGMGTMAACTHKAFALLAETPTKFTQWLQLSCVHVTIAASFLPLFCWFRKTELRFLKEAMAGICVSSSHDRRVWLCACAPFVWVAETV